MIEVFGNVWDYPADVICIPTNGIVKPDGRAVMGAGVAKQALDMFPGIDVLLGDQINENGNHVAPFAGLMAFPVKHHWRERADLILIAQSAIELAALVDPELAYVLPRPGCGNGRLSWWQVHPVIEDILPDNVHVIELEEATWHKI